MTTALCWLAAAVWLSAASGVRSRARSGSRHRGTTHRRANHSPVNRSPANRSPAIAQAAGAIATVIGCVALAGPRAGTVAALLAAPVVAVLLRRLQARQHPGAARHELARTPMVLDLVAVVLAAGQPVAAALRVAAPSAGPWLGHQLEQVAGLLRLGAEPAEAWGVLAGEPALRPVVLAAVRSSGSGIRLAGAFTELAVELRAVARAAAQARAQRAGVWSIAPLGLCFLPAFVCIGIVPVVIGVAGDILIGLVA